MKKLVNFGKKVVYTIGYCLYWTGLVCTYLMYKLVGALETALGLKKQTTSEDL